MNEALFNIVRYMNRMNRPLKSSELATKMELKIRTVRYEISKSRDELLRYGMRIESMGKAGYQLQILDEKLAREFLESDVAREKTDMELEEEILYALLNAPLGYRLDDLAEKLYVSRSTVSRIMSSVREILREFDLELDVKPYAGMKIVGSEIKKRFCLVKYFPNKLEEGTDKSIEQYRLVISVIVKNALEEFQIQIKDISFENLILHLAIAVHRIQNGNFINDVVETTDVTSVRDVAERIAENLAEQFDIEIPESERKYISLHLLGKQWVRGQEKEDEELQRLIFCILDEIYQVFGYDFRKDFDLNMHLMMHIKPMLVRAKYAMRTENPLLENIKLEMQNGYECALAAGRVIQREAGLRLSEDELGYIAMHFALALEGNKNKQKILIVCSSGYGTSAVLKKKILHTFDVSRYEIEVGDYLSLKNRNLREYDYIFSTIPLKDMLGYPVIYVDNVFTFNFERYRKKSVSETVVLHFLKPDQVLAELECSTKEQVLDQMIRYMEERFGIDPAVGESIRQREQISSTEVGNRIAIPHPVKRMTEETLILVGVLKREIMWNKRMVRCVIMTCYSKETDPLQDEWNDRITDFVIDAQKITDFLKNPSYESLVDLI